MTFDSSINIGQLVELAFFLFALIGGWFALKGSVKELEITGDLRHKENVSSLDEVKSSLKSLTDVLVRQAAQDTKIEMMMDRVRFLERQLMGEGGQQK